MISTIRLGQWGYYALRRVFGSAIAVSGACCEAQLQVTKTNVRAKKRRRSVAPFGRNAFDVPVFRSSGFGGFAFGQYLSCFMKCVGAWCTRLRYRVAAVQCKFCSCSLLCALSFSALCTSFGSPRLIYSSVLLYADSWKSMKGGLCGNND